jgi:type 1 glutamine amidotransferase
MEQEQIRIKCDHCLELIDHLEAFPAKRNGSGSACLGCFITHVDSKRTDSERFGIIMGAFNAEPGEVIIERRVIMPRPVKRGAR